MRLRPRRDDPPIRTKQARVVTGKTRDDHGATRWLERVADIVQPSGPNEPQSLPSGQAGRGVRWRGERFRVGAVGRSRACRHAIQFWHDGCKEVGVFATHAFSRSSCTTNSTTSPTPTLWGEPRGWTQGSSGARALRPMASTKARASRSTRLGSRIVAEGWARAYVVWGDAYRHRRTVVWLRAGGPERRNDAAPFVDPPPRAWAHRFAGWITSCVEPRPGGRSHAQLDHTTSPSLGGIGDTVEVIRPEFRGVGRSCVLGSPHVRPTP